MKMLLKRQIMIYIKTSRNNTFLTSTKNFVLFKKNKIIKNLKKYKIKVIKEIINVKEDSIVYTVGHHFIKNNYSKDFYKKNSNRNSKDFYKKNSNPNYKNFRTYKTLKQSFKSFIKRKARKARKVFNIEISKKTKKAYKKFLNVSKVINWASSGTAGFEKSQKGFPYAGEMAGIQLGLKLKKKYKKKLLNLEIKIKGRGRKRRYEALKGLNLALGKKKI